METEARWYWSPMRPLGWVETLLKLCAFAVAYGTLALAPEGAHALAFPGHRADAARLIAALVLALGLLVGIYDRYLDRELFAMCFIFANIAAHLCFAYSVLVGLPQRSLWLFPALMLFGDIVKVTSIRLYNMRVRDIAQWVLYLLTAVYLIGDLLMLLPALRLL